VLQSEESHESFGEFHLEHSCEDGGPPRVEDCTGDVKGDDTDIGEESGGDILKITATTLMNLGISAAGRTDQAYQQHIRTHRAF